MAAQELTNEQVLYQMLWSRRDAARWLRLLGGPQYFAGVVYLGATIAAIVEDHDRARPQAPAEGPERVTSIYQHAAELARDVKANPERYTDPAAGLHARNRGLADPALLVHAPAALGVLPGLVTIGDVGTEAD